MGAGPELDVETAAHRERIFHWALVALGGAMFAGALVLAASGFDDVDKDLGDYALEYSPLVGGIGLALFGLQRLAGYKAFVAFRYLLVAQPKVTRTTKMIIVVTLFGGLAYQILFGPPFSLTSPAWLGLAAINAVWLIAVVAGVLVHSKPAFFVFLIGIVIMGVCGVGTALVQNNAMPFVGKLDSDRSRLVLQVLGITSIGGGVLVTLALLFGTLRGFFTFFTTVPIGGVWIGTAALVCVLAVMSGFESDLREKILGSNAHIQITREDGEFTDWREVKKRIDQIPGVVASTPYAVSEVVIAANNNGMNVIIKGIDPATVGTVTDLVSDLVTQCPPAPKTNDREAMQKLLPLVPEVHDRTVRQAPRPAGGTDPLPDDMPNGGDPIDFSGSGDLDKPDAPTPDGGSSRDNGTTKDNGSLKTRGSSKNDGGSSKNDGS
jgi:MacB-like protein